MDLYFAYARGGHEFEAQQECADLGIACYVPRKVDLIRQGTRRFFEKSVRPFLPNYIFIETDDHGWHALRGSKLIRNLIFISPQEAIQVQRFITRIEQDFATRMAQIDAGERVSMYDDGDALEILSGTLKGRMATFRRIVEGGNGFPQIVVEVGEMFGQPIVTRLDPLAVRKAGE